MIMTFSEEIARIINSHLLIVRVKIILKQRKIIFVNRLKHHNFVAWVILKKCSVFNRCWHVL